MKNHINQNGLFAQTNKRHWHLKLKQKGKIQLWLYDELCRFYDEFDRLPYKSQDRLIIVNRMMSRLSKERIDLSYHEMEKLYSKYIRRMKRRFLKSQ